MPPKQKQKSKEKSLTNEEIQQNYSKLQNELQALAQKIGELESEAEEHDLVLATLVEQMQKDPDRKCFRMIGGVLVERTVKDVVPSLQTNLEGIKRVVTTLAGQYKSKEEEFTNFVKEYNIQARA
ncbi:Prefoldin beta-like protein [Serendipita vermifera]|nr:Prefoldin beta-like protein [Serendipita vermifera]